MGGILGEAERSMDHNEAASAWLTGACDSKSRQLDARAARVDCKVYNVVMAMRYEDVAIVAWMI